MAHPLARRALAVLVALAAATAFAGCGQDDQTVGERVRQEARDVRERAQRRIEHVRKRIEEVLAQFRQAVPQAQTTDPDVRGRGQTSKETIDAFLSRLLASVDSYWTQTLKANGRPEPRVFYSWIPPGIVRRTGCGAPADQSAAFYCPADDTIYVAQRFAAELYQGTLRNLPGERAGFGRAAGEFGVAYVIAHEYAHNLQNELGWFRLGRGNSSKPFELQADCLAGTWGNSVYASGRYDRSDVADAVNTAQAVGDFDYTNANHHGTPRERADAWLAGFDSGDPSVCSRYVPA
jgi:predicted metalloprotease